MIEKKLQSLTQVNGMTKAIIQKTYLLNGLMVIFFLFCHITLHWEKVTSHEKSSDNLTFKVQIVWEISAFQCYWSKYRIANCWKIVEISKFSINMKYSKILYEAQTVSHLKKFIKHPPIQHSPPPLPSPPPPPPDKSFLRL